MRRAAGGNGRMGARGGGAAPATPTWRMAARFLPDVERVTAAVAGTLQLPTDSAANAAAAAAAAAMSSLLLVGLKPSTC